MLSEDTLNRYRQMSLGARLELVLRMIKEQTPGLFEGAPQIVQRRFEVLRRQNDERNRALREGLARVDRVRHE